MKYKTTLSFWIGLLISQGIVAQENTTLINQFGDPIRVAQSQHNYNKDYFDAKQTTESEEFQRVSAVNTESLRVSASIQPTQVTEIFSLGQGIGVKGNYLGDFNGDGNNEIILAQPQHIALVDVVEGEYQLNTRINFESSIAATALYHNVNADRSSVFVVVANELHEIDLITRKSTKYNLASHGRNITVGHFTSEKEHELLIFTDYELIVLSAVSKEEKARFSTNAGNGYFGSFTTANAREILLQDGQIVSFSDSGTLKVVKTLTELPYYRNQIVDINGDGLEDVVSAESWYNLKAWSPASDSVLWSTRADLDINALILADINNDGKKDVVYGDGQWGSLYALSIDEGKQFWTIANPGHGVTNILVGDVDKDGKMDIGWGAGYSSSGADHYYVHDVESKENKWKSEDLDFPVDQLALLDVNSDGTLDVVYALDSTNSGYDNGVLLAIDTKTNKEIWRTPLTDNWSRQVTLKVAEIEGITTPVIYIGGSQIYTGHIAAYYANTGEALFSTTLTSGDYINSLEVADLDADGQSELIVTNGSNHSGSAGRYVRVLNAKTGEILKTSLNALTGFSSNMQLVAFDDPATSGSDVYISSSTGLSRYNYSENQLKTIVSDLPISAIDIVVHQGSETLVAASGGKIYTVTLDGQSSAVATICDSNIQSLATLLPSKLVFTCDDKVGNYDLSTNEELYSMPTFGIGAIATASTRFQNIEYSAFGGSDIRVFSNEAAPMLEKPIEQSIAVHVKGLITGELNPSQDVDYIVLEGTPKYGQFKFTNRQRGQFTYQPTGQVGIDELSFYAVKGRSLSDKASLVIETTNTAPTVQSFVLSTHWNTQITEKLQAADADNEPLTFELSSQPTTGELVLLDSSAGTFQFTPSGESLSPVRFNYLVKDSLVASVSGSVIVEFTNQAPIAENITYQTSYLTPVHGKLDAIDPDSDAITYRITAQPNAGALMLNEQNGLFVYTPVGETDQLITFSYKVSDKFAESEVKTVTLNVAGKPEIVKEKSSGSTAYILALLACVGARRRFFCNVGAASALNSSHSNEG